MLLRLFASMKQYVDVIICGSGYPLFSSPPREKTKKWEVGLFGLECSYDNVKL